MARNKSRIVADKLPWALRHQLVLDFEQYSTDTWKQFAARKLRDEYWFGSLTGAAENRFVYLKSKKRQDPANYWKLVAEATNASSTRQAEKDSSDEFCGSDSEEDDEERSAASSATKIKSPPVKSPPPKKVTSLPRKTNPVASPSRSSPSIKKMPPKHSKPPRAPPSTASSYRVGYAPSIYGSIEEAEMDADVIIRVDFGKPQKNGAPLFYVQEIPNVKSDDGRVLISKAKITLNNLTDLRDYEQTKGIVVCEGQAFLVRIPALPFYRRSEKEILDQYAKEAVRCARTEEDYLANVLSIASDPEQLTTKYLFIMPEDYIVSGDMTSDVYPSGDYNCQLLTRPWKTKFTRGEGARAKEYEHMYCPGFWLLRIVSAGSAPLREAESEQELGFEDSFAGMQIS
jgi:hypothetical protein